MSLFKLVSISCCCIHLVIGIQTAIQQQPLDITSKCWSVVKVLPPPKSDWQTKFLSLFPALHRLRNESPANREKEIQIFLFEQCVSRYHELLAQNTINDALIKSSTQYQRHLVDSFLSDVDKESLIVLDLDETLIGAFLYDLQFIKQARMATDIRSEIRAKGSVVGSFIGRSLA